MNNLKFADDIDIDLLDVVDTKIMKLDAEKADAVEKIQTDKTL